MLFLRLQILAHPVQIQPQKENTKERKTPTADAVSSPTVCIMQRFTPSVTILTIQKSHATSTVTHLCL